MKETYKTAEPGCNILCIQESKRKKSYTPKTAGNKSFRLHNNIKFSRTAEERKIGKSNKM